MNKYDLQASKLVGDTQTCTDIKAGKSGCDLSIFNDARANEAMWIEFETREIEVTSGTIKCKCGSNKVYTAKRQTRGGDEGMTFYVKCAKQSCGRIWTL